MVKSVIKKGVTFNESGYLENYEEWDLELAKIIAIDEGVEELAAEHWKLIYFLRDYYRRNQDGPMIRMICHKTGLCLKDIYRLFPTGPVKGLFRIAGLPRPTNCL